MSCCGEGECGNVSRSISLVGEEVVAGGQGFRLTWPMLEGALRSDGMITDDECIFQVDIEEEGVVLMVREK